MKKNKIIKYKCFTIEIDCEKILIKDEFENVVDIIYDKKQKEEIFLYIDEMFKCN